MAVGSVDAMTRTGRQWLGAAMAAGALALFTGCHSDGDRQFNQRRADCFAEHSGESDAVRICMGQP